MGVLYSMFPVLVCDEVPANVHPYADSGWCFSEITIATLGGQLNEFSPGFACEFADLGNDFFDSFNLHLSTKKFRSEDDRDTVRNICTDFARKRRLVDAIKQNRPTEIEAIIGDVADPAQLQRLLDLPTDPSLNTMLHRAVAMRSAVGVRIFIQAGARIDLRNLHGDLPHQFRMFPRFGAAAAAYRQPPSFANLHSGVVCAAVGAIVVEDMSDDSS